MLGTFSARGLDIGKRTMEQQETRMQVFAAVLDDAFNRKIATHGWHQVRADIMCCFVHVLCVIVCHCVFYCAGLFWCVVLYLLCV
jgi:hypothetical protein